MATRPGAIRPKRPSAVHCLRQSSRSVSGSTAGLGVPGAWDLRGALAPARDLDATALDATALDSTALDAAAATIFEGCPRNRGPPLVGSKRYVAERTSLGNASMARRTLQEMIVISSAVRD